MGDADRTHEVADRRSLVLHREVARRLLIDPTLFTRARARVETWANAGSVHPYYLDAWRRAFDAGLPAVRGILEDPGEMGQALRQASPFAFVLSARERWRLLREASSGDTP